jgi:hypothetical protein
MFELLSPSNFLLDRGENLKSLSSVVASSTCIGGLISLALCAVVTGTLGLLPLVLDAFLPA